MRAEVVACRPPPNRPPQDREHLLLRLVKPAGADGLAQFGLASLSTEGGRQGGFDFVGIGGGRLARFSALR
jgi:hypothetical protein